MSRPRGIARTAFVIVAAGSPPALEAAFLLLAALSLLAIVAAGRLPGRHPMGAAKPGNE